MNAIKMPQPRLLQPQEQPPLPLQPLHLLLLLLLPLHLPQLLLKRIILYLYTTCNLCEAYFILLLKYN